MTPHRAALWTRPLAAAAVVLLAGLAGLAAVAAVQSGLIPAGGAVPGKRPPAAAADAPVRVAPGKVYLSVIREPGPEDEKYPLPQNPERMKAVRAARLADARATTVEAFEAHGDTKAAWADKARTALEAVARRIARWAKYDNAERRAEAVALKAALDAGCDDPLVRYFGVLHLGMGLKTPDEQRAAVVSVRDGLTARKYPTRQRMRVSWYLADLSHPTDGQLPHADAGQDLERFWAEVTAACRLNHPATDGDVLEVIEDALDLYAREPELGGRPAGYEAAVAALKAGGAGAWMRAEAEGRYHLSYAWEARGERTVDAIPADNWRQFGDRMRKAEAAFAAAWAADPSRPSVPVRMLGVALGMGYPRDDMEVWFRRAMEADPDDYWACRQKDNYLEPKWYGSVEEQNAFLRQCVRTKNTVAGLPLVAFDHHAPVFAADALSADIDRRWPTILNLETKALLCEAFEPHLDANPDDRVCRAYFFCLCAMWNEVPAAEYHLTKLGGPPDGFVFGKRPFAEFYEMYTKRGGKPVPGKK